MDPAPRTLDPRRRVGGHRSFLGPPDGRVRGSHRVDQHPPGALAGPAKWHWGRRARPRLRSLRSASSRRGLEPTTAWTNTRGLAVAASNATRGSRETSRLANWLSSGLSGSPERRKPENRAISRASVSTATGIRTPVFTMRGRRPSPLDDSGAKSIARRLAKRSELVSRTRPIHGVRQKAARVTPAQRLRYLRIHADVAELVDAHGSGPCPGNLVEVRVLSSAFWLSLLQRSCCKGAGSDVRSLGSCTGRRKSRGGDPAPRRAGPALAPLRRSRSLAAGQRDARSCPERERAVWLPGRSLSARKRERDVSRSDVGQRGAFQAGRARTSGCACLRMIVVRSVPWLAVRA